MMLRMIPHQPGQWSSLLEFWRIWQLIPLFRVVRSPLHCGQATGGTQLTEQFKKLFERHGAGCEASFPLEFDRPVPGKHEGFKFGLQVFGL